MYLNKQSLLCLFLFVLCFAGCKSKSDDLQPKTLLLTKSEWISPPGMSVWPGYNVSLPAHRQYYTDYEYDNQNRLVSIKAYRDNYLYKSNDNRPDDLEDSYSFTYDQSNKLSKVTKYIKNQYSALPYYEQYSTFTWSDKKLLFTEYYAILPSQQLSISCQFSFDLNDKGLPIKCTRANSDQVYTYIYDSNDNIIQVNNNYGVEYKNEFSSDKLSPLSNSYSLFLWKSMVNRGCDMLHINSKNWLEKQAPGGISYYTFPEKVVETNSEKYITKTRIILESGGLPVNSPEDTLLVKKYTYVLK